MLEGIELLGLLEEFEERDELFKIDGCDGWKFYDYEEDDSITMLWVVAFCCG